MKLEITKQDIKKAEKLREERLKDNCANVRTFDICPFACALNRTFKTDDARAQSTLIVGEHCFRVTNTIWTYMKLYDNGYPVTPQTFKLENYYEWLLKWSKKT